jgi:hypothetical protein
VSEVHLQGVMLCCAVLYHAVVCCAVSCCGVLCCIMLCCAVLYHALLCCAVSCCAVLCCIMLCCAVLYHAVLCCAVSCCVVLCCIMLCCAVLCRWSPGVSYDKDASGAEAAYPTNVSLLEQNECRSPDGLLWKQTTEGALPPLPPGLFAAAKGGVNLHVDMSATTTVAMPTKREHPHCGRETFTHCDPEEPQQWSSTSGEKPHRAGPCSVQRAPACTLVNNHSEVVCAWA